MNRRKILSTPAMAQLDIHHHGIYSALDITLQVLSQRAREILGLLACFNYAGFPLDLIERAANRGFRFEPRDLVDRPPEFEDTVKFLTGIFCPDGVWSEIDLEDILVELEEYSLVVRVENYSLKTLRFHPLVHAWMFDCITAAFAQRYQSAALRLLVCGTAEEDEDLHEQLIPHLVPLSSTWENCHANDLAGVARLITYEGKMDRAVELWEKIVNDVTENSGWTDSRTYRSRLQLTLVRQWPLDIFTIKNDYMAILPLDEILEAITCKHEMDLYNNDQNLHLQQNVVKTLRKRDGVNLSFLTLKAMEALAMMHRRQRQLEKAIDLLSTTLHHRQILHGQNHVITLRTRESLLFLKSKRDGLSLRPGDPRYNEMAKQMEDVVMQWTSLQGPDHPGTLKAQASLAEFYEDHDQHHQALPIRQAVVKGWTRRNGIDNLNTVGARRMLAKLHEILAKLDERLGNMEDAITHWRLAVEGYRAIGTIHDDNLQQAAVSLASLYRTAERYDDEAVMWDQVLKDSKQVQKAQQQYNGTIVLEAMEALARQFEKLTRLDDAVVQWKRVIRVAMITYDYYACEYMVSLAELFHRLGRDDDAVALCEGGVKWTMDSSHFILRNLERLARHFEELGWYDKAVPVWKRFIRKYTLWGHSSGIANPRTPLAKVLDKMGQHKEAAIQWECAFKWKAKGYGRNTKSRLLDMESAANAYEKAGLMDKAEAIRERRKRWEEHQRWHYETPGHGKYAAMDWDILRTDQEEVNRDEDENDEDEQESDISRLWSLRRSLKGAELE